MAGKLMDRPGLSSNKGPGPAASPETESPRSNPETSPPKKRKAPGEAATADSACSLDATAAGAGMQINMLLSRFTELLSESAAADTSQMRELEGLVTEARKLESFLREKKNKLRQTLALISDNLQS